MMLIIFESDEEAREFETKVHPDAYTIVGQVKTDEVTTYPSFIYQITDPMWKEWWLEYTNNDPGHQIINLQ